MFEKLKKNKLMVILLCVIVLFNGTAAFASNTDIERINPNNYPRDSRERYVASIALQKDITYEEADKLEKQELARYGLDEQGFVLFSNDEYLRYKTIDKRAGRIQDGSIYNQDVYIATEVRYVWNRVYNKLVYIESIGGPYVYIPGASNVSITGGDMVVEKYANNARISRTCSFVYQTSGGSVTVGGDIISFTKNWAGVTITTRAKTVSISITESDLR